ncbi:MULTISPECIES: TetR/AcrR family transcriptional regulator [Rhodococcus]|uniref:TetR/AcrR family transcriptional regulator n=1 Tax=Rhodococcus jostii TaxID=132919 RepID=A0ABU4CKM8_RHOJO|nr:MULTISPECIES: TetR/AcrR family transcriptional regulator [Rhodococcus]MDH6286796.1 AcrR family transcriptional regulator [Rhodococcus opacus]MDV6284116.1 TetR/AcrR family transcriptional regulator [Rhodococcus jostii]
MGNRSDHPTGEGRPDAPGLTRRSQSGLRTQGLPERHHHRHHDRAGKAAGSFYNHFDGKEALLLALADDIGDDADALVTTSPDDLRNLGPHLAVFWQLQSRHRTVMSALRDAALVDPEFAQRMHDFGIEQMKPWAELLTTLSADGAHLPASPDVSAQLLAAVATVFVGLWDGDDDAGIAALTRFVERGLLG